MKRLPLTLIATAALAAGAASTPAAAGADTLLAPAPGAVNLAAGGGYLAWFAPQEDTGWKLVVRNPDGTVVEPDVPFFPGPTQLSIGSDITGSFDRALVVAYTRSDGDIHTLDLRTGRETRIRELSTRTYTEYAPQIELGVYAFVRRGGKRPGIYVARRGGEKVVRVTRDTPSDLAFNGSRVAYPKGNTIVVRRISGRGPTVVYRAGSRPSSPTMTRYRVAWLERATGTVRQTARFGGSGKSATRVVETAGRRIPSTQSIVMDRSQSANTFLDGQGVKQALPPLFQP
ncbi:MAG TPA: hypothetical protein VN238_01625 [Solirubrobacteraceae bacterium]|nr:hypothetical protein [Solirubrobacteraceae bacterium]